MCDGEFDGCLEFFYCNLGRGVLCKSNCDRMCMFGDECVVVCYGFWFGCVVYGWWVVVIV